MKNVLFIFSIFILTSTGCQNENYITLLQKEYGKLKRDSKSYVEIISIRILENQKMQFNNIAEHEIQRMLSLNDNLYKMAALRFEKDSLIRMRIENRYQHYKYANRENQLKYEIDDKNDSQILENETRQRLYNELEIAENETRISEIQSLANNDAINQLENHRIKHEIDFKRNHEILTDTLIFISLANKKYNYLTRNIFRDNR